MHFYIAVFCQMSNRWSKKERNKKHWTARRRRRSWRISGSNILLPRFLCTSSFVLLRLTSHSPTPFLALSVSHCLLSFTLHWCVGLYLCLNFTIHLASCTYCALRDKCMYALMCVACVRIHVALGLCASNNFLFSSALASFSINDILMLAIL